MDNLCEPRQTFVPRASHIFNMRVFMIRLGNKKGADADVAPAPGLGYYSVSAARLVHAERVLKGSDT